MVETAAPARCPPGISSRGQAWPGSRRTGVMERRLSAPAIPPLTSAGAAPQVEQLEAEYSSRAPCPVPRGGGLDSASGKSLSPRRGRGKPTCRGTDEYLLASLASGTAYTYPDFSKSLFSGLPSPTWSVAAPETVYLAVEIPEMLKESPPGCRHAGQSTDPPAPASLPCTPLCPIPPVLARQQGHRPAAPRPHTTPS